MVTIFLSNRDVTLELPFTLSHPKPAEETPPPTPVQSAPSEEAAPGKYNIRRMGGRIYFCCDCKPSAPRPTTTVHRGVSR